MTSSQYAPRSAFATLLRIAVLCVGIAAMMPTLAMAQLHPPGTLPQEGHFDGKKGVDTWWIDSGDGVNPAAPGCHEEVVSRTNPARTGRRFGESCKGNLLIETTPGRNVIHVHPRDIGHPLQIDCSVWCQKAQGARAGVCRPVSGPAPCATSAICACN